MHEHGPDEFPGPVRGTSAWWKGTATELPADEPQKPPKKRRKTRKDDQLIRTELVERIRKEIAAGTYDTEEKWEAALDCMLGRLDAGD
jgi:hypothetical protein